MNSRLTVRSVLDSTKKIAGMLRKRVKSGEFKNNPSELHELLYNMHINFITLFEHCNIPVTPRLKKLHDSIRFSMIAVGIYINHGVNERYVNEATKL